LSKDDRQKFLKPALSEDDVLTIDLESLANHRDSDDNDLADIATAPSEKTLQQLREENIDLICQLNKCRKLLVEITDGPPYPDYGVGDRSGSIECTSNGDSNAQFYPFTPPYCGLPMAMLALRDSISCSAYHNFVQLNAAELFSGKTVLHLAAGAGLLTMFLARARPEHIFAVEASKDLAMAIRQAAASNGVEDCVEVLEGKVNDLQRSCYRDELDSKLPGDSLAKINIGKVDVILCDWMGPLLFYRSNLPAVVEAARSHLRLPEGRIYPRHAVLNVTGLECSQHLLQSYCVNTSAAVSPLLQSTLSALRSPICRLAYLFDVSAEVAADRARILGRPVAAAAAYGEAPAARIEVDLLSLCSDADGLRSLPGSHDFALLIEGPRGGRDCQLNALVAYFDCRMDDDAEFNVGLLGSNDLFHLSIRQVNPLHTNSFLFGTSPIGLQRCFDPASKQPVSSPRSHLFQDTFGDLTAADFDHKKWINMAMASVVAAENPETSLTSLVRNLQSALDGANLDVENTFQEVAQSTPR
uniref:ANK_REP_REGION domain-containing protein n=1 Tax=Schistocephalus solidus TaxID=70667 RepID=A0A183S977_SCHSO